VKFKKLGINFSFDGSFGSAIDAKTTTKEFYKYFVKKFMMALYERNQFFCDECGTTFDPFGYPEVSLLDSPLRLRVTMGLSCECSTNQDIYSGNSGDDSSFFSYDGITSLGLPEEARHEI